MASLPPTVDVSVRPATTRWIACSATQTVTGVVGMERIYRLGDRVRVVIADVEDPDYRYHGRTGTVTAVIADSLSTLTGDPRDDYRYCVVFDSEGGLGMWFRHEDLTRITGGENASE